VSVTLLSPVDINEWLRKATYKRESDRLRAISELCFGCLSFLGVTIWKKVTKLTKIHKFVKHSCS